jgi:uncharacterized protein YfbU (UPF0304 family)
LAWSIFEAAYKRENLDLNEEELNTVLTMLSLTQEEQTKIGKYLQKERPDTYRKGYDTYEKLTENEKKAFSTFKTKINAESTDNPNEFYRRDVVERVAKLRTIPTKKESAWSIFEAAYRRENLDLNEEELNTVLTMLSLPAEEKKKALNNLKEERPDTNRKASKTYEKLTENEKNAYSTFMAEINTESTDNPNEFYKGESQLDAAHEESQNTCNCTDTCVASKLVKNFTDILTCRNVHVLQKQELKEHEWRERVKGYLELHVFKSTDRVDKELKQIFERNGEDNSDFRVFISIDEDSDLIVALSTCEAYICTPSRFFRTIHNQVHTHLLELVNEVQTPFKLHHKCYLTNKELVVQHLPLHVAVARQYLWTPGVKYGSLATHNTRRERGVTYPHVYYVGEHSVESDDWILIRNSNSLEDASLAEERSLIIANEEL